MPTTGGALSKPKKLLPASADAKKKGSTSSTHGTSLRLGPTRKTSDIVPSRRDDTDTGGVAERTTTGSPGSVAAPWVASRQGDTNLGGTGSAAGTGGGGNSGSMPGGYTPMGYGDIRWNQPEALAQDFLSGLGITNPEMIGLVGDLVNSLPALQLIMSGDPNMDSQAQFDTDYLTQMTTPGGSALDVASLMEALSTADPNSAAGMFMMNPETSSEDIVGLAMNLLNAAGTNPYYQRGYEGLMQSNLRNYEIDKAKGAQGYAASPFYQSALNQYGG